MIEVSSHIEALIHESAKREGVSVDMFLERLISAPNTAPASTGLAKPASRLPRLHLGDVGPLHRRDIYNDGR